LHKSVSYRYISSNDIESIRKEIDEMNKSLVPLKGTMQVHQVASVSKGKVKTCATSCYCKDCVMGNLHDCSKGGLFKSSRRPQSSEHVEQVEQQGVVENEPVEQLGGVVENEQVEQQGGVVENE
jgi:hypothetical protein